VQHEKSLQLHNRARDDRARKGRADSSGARDRPQSCSRSVRAIRREQANPLSGAVVTETQGAHVAPHTERFKLRWLSPDGFGNEAVLLEGEGLTKNGWLSPFPRRNCKMNATHHSPLTDEQIATALHLCFKNSDKLSREAAILEASGSEERAIALMILSLEELAKIPIVFDALRFAPENTGAWKRFWRSWRSHSAKQAIWSFYGELLSKGPPHTDADAFSNRYPPGTNIDAVKQHGLYVSFTDGAFQSPEEFARVNDDVLPWLHGLLAGRLESFRALHGDIEDSRRMVAHFRLITLDPASWDEATKARAAEIQSTHGHDFFERLRKPRD
jgi:AbiV family abortive infection protein